jgi:hypothetical protein
MSVCETVRKRARWAVRQATTSGDYAAQQYADQYYPEDSTVPRLPPLGQQVRHDVSHLGLCPDVCGASGSVTVPRLPPLGQQLRHDVSHLGLCPDVCGASGFGRRLSHWGIRRRTEILVTLHELRTSRRRTARSSRRLAAAPATKVRSPCSGVQ